MATATLTPYSVFPPGTQVSVYRPWQGGIDRSPSGAAITTSTVSDDGSLTFTDLLDGTQYVAYAFVDGRHRYVGFGTDTAAARDTAAAISFSPHGTIQSTTVQAAIEEVASEAGTGGGGGGVATGARLTFSQASGAPAIVVGSPKSPPLWFAGTVTRVGLSVVSAPEGGPLTVQFLKNGVLFTTLQIVDGSTTTTTSTDGLPSAAVNDEFTVNATEVGSGVAAQGITAFVEVT